MTDYGNRLTMIGIFVSTIGVMVIVASLVLSSLSTPNGGSTSYGGVIVIGPIPIVFGSDRNTVLIAVVGAVILMVMALAAMIVNSKRTRSLVRESST